MENTGPTFRHDLTPSTVIGTALLVTARATVAIVIGSIIVLDHGHSTPSVLGSIGTRPSAISVATPVLNTSAGPPNHFAASHFLSICAPPPVHPYFHQQEPAPATVDGINFANLFEVRPRVRRSPRSTMLIPPIPLIQC